MIYTFKEYKKVLDTPAKVQQERVIVQKIMDLLNKNKYDNLDEFINKNNTYQDFLKKNEMDTVVKHFGNALTEEDYKNILNNLIYLTKDKKEFDNKNIKTTNIDDKQYNSLKGDDKTYFVDNSNSSKTIEEQMKSIQGSKEEFQTADMKTNTENMFKELENNKKESFNLQSLNEINKDTLNNDEIELLMNAADYQLRFQKPIKIDIKKGIIVDENNNILRIEKENGQISIKGDENDIETSEVNIQKIPQKQLGARPNPNTIYSN